MTTVYFIRHAQAQGNVDRVFQGRYDGKLTDFGYKQLACLSARCKEFSFDCIYSSPLSRAYETAQAANRHYEYEIHTDDGLLEIDGGDWEEKKWDTFPERDSVQNNNWYHNPYEFCAPNGEPMKKAYTRICNAILQIVKNNKNNTICIVTHGCILSCAINWLQNKQPHELTSKTVCDNAAITKATFDDALTPHLEYFNDTTHLSDDLKVSVSRMWVK